MNINMSEEFKGKLKGYIREIIETTVFVVTMVILIRFFFGEIRWIPSGSMRPTLIEGDRIFVERVTQFFHKPKRGDVMVFYPPMVNLSQNPWDVFKRLTGFFCSDIAYIKRVVGMPGDKLFITTDSEGRYAVYVNGKRLKEDYILDKYDFIPCSKEMYCGPFVVPPHSYFMMGDNRGNSQDSRFWGFLPENRFIGHAVVVFWPFTRAGKIK